MNYSTLSALLQGRNYNRRKLKNNTYAERRDNQAIAIRLHNTDILTFHQDGKIVVTSGGWKTVTTKARLNEYLEDYGISQEKGLWSWVKRGNGWEAVAVFTDGDAIVDGELHPQNASNQKEKNLRKKIMAYAKLYVDAIPMNPPDGGDCWFCCMTTENKTSLGEATGNTDHLLSHIKEKYVVPSLAYHALKSKGCGDLILHGAFTKDQGHLNDIAKRYIGRAVRAYLFKQFGLAR